MSKRLMRLSGVAVLAVLAAMLVLASTVLAAVATASDSTPGFADNSVEVRSVALDVEGAVTDVNVAVDFQKIATQDCANPFSDGASFAYHAEISMFLTSPAGTIVNLVYDDDHPLGPTYGDTNNYDDLVGDRAVVTFDDEAAAAAGGWNPVTGSFRPAEPLSAFDGEPAAGTWTFTFGDNSSWDYLCYYGFELAVETDYVEPVDEPTEEPAPMLCTTGDGSLNALHCGRPVAVFARGGGFAIYGVDINTGHGALAEEVGRAAIDEAGVPTGGPVVIAEGQNPYNHQPFTLYRLPGGEFQLNTFYWDGKPYVVKWAPDASAVSVVEW